MEEYSEECFGRKLEHIKRVYDHMYSGNDRQRQHIITLRGWCITLIVAYMGYCASKDCSPNWLVFIIMFVCFFALEGFNKLNCWEIKKEIRKIDKMFLRKDDKEFRHAVSDYEFFSLLYEKYQGHPWKKLGYEIREYYRATKNDKHAIAWYFFILIAFSIVALLLTQSKG